MYRAMPSLSVTMVPSDELAVLSSVTSAWVTGAGALDDEDSDEDEDVDDDPAADDDAAGVGVGVDEPQAAERRRTAPARAAVLKDRARIMLTSSRGTPDVTSERRNACCRETVHMGTT
jgi:hypothetical protein